MADQEDRNPSRQEVKDAIVAIAETSEGRTFFRALASRCYFTRSVIAANPQSHDINVHGTLFNEAQRRLYLDIRRDIPARIRRMIENQIPKEEK